MILVSDYIRKYLIDTVGTANTIPVYNETLPPTSTGEFLLVEGNISLFQNQMLSYTEWDIVVKSQSNISKEQARQYSIEVLSLLGDTSDLNLSLDSNSIRIVKCKAYASLLFIGEAKKNFFQYSNRFRVSIQNSGE